MMAARPPGGGDNGGGSAGNSGDSGGSAVDFRILGPLDILVDGTSQAMPGGKPKGLLAVLLINRNRVVSADAIADAIWDGDSPASYLGILQVYMSTLRRSLRTAGADGQAVITTQAPGYRLSADDACLDLGRFTRWMAAGNELLRAERFAEASARYRADAVLIGHVRPGTFGNEVEWLFVHGVERQALPRAGIRDGLDVAADRYAADLSTIGGASVTMLTVHNVSTPADYGRVVSYLERQSILESVDVESFDNGTLGLRVAARGDARVLERVLALGGVLRPAAATSAVGSLAFEVVPDGLSP